MAGNPRAARQVVRILHASSSAENLPWHRVVNSKGRIGLKPGQGFELQKAMLEQEGICFEDDNSIRLESYQWLPG
jgi:methylated-DNA-protein-cysteine methyltransferase-like protein